MNKILSHDMLEETPEGKALWFQSLSLQERMEMLDAFTDLILELRPEVAERKHAQPSKGSILIVSLENLISSKKAAPRPVDLEDARLLTLNPTEPTEEDNIP